MCAYADVVTAGQVERLELMLSLGTGEHTRAYTFDQARSWGQLEWARPALDMVFDGVADTIEFESKALMDDRYVRLQTELDVASDDLDDASAGEPRRPAHGGRASDRRVGRRARPRLRDPRRLTPALTVGEPGL